MGGTEEEEEMRKNDPEESSHMEEGRGGLVLWALVLGAYDGL